jgi:hypothetical protein
MPWIQSIPLSLEAKWRSIMASQCHGGDLDPSLLQDTIGATAAATEVSYSWRPEHQRLWYQVRKDYSDELRRWSRSSTIRVVGKDVVELDSKHWINVGKDSWLVIIPIERRKNKIVAMSLEGGVVEGLSWHLGQGYDLREGAAIRPMTGSIIFEAIRIC